jgi:hypothetical protein
MIDEVTTCPARTFEDAAKLLRPEMPVADEADAVALYEDLDELRGGARLAVARRNIHQSGGAPTIQFVTGLLGSGKTTELFRLLRSLKQRRAADPELVVLYYDAQELLHRADLDLEDLLLALWRMMLHRDPGVANEVLPELWEKSVAGALASVVPDLPASLPDALSRVIELLELQSAEQSAPVRQALGRATNGLLEGLRVVFAELASGRAGAVVLVIDNLEKITERPDRPDLRRVIETLYLERLGSLRRLGAHLIITTPAFLVWSSSAASSLNTIYGGELITLPMMKLRASVAQGGGEFEPGVRHMMQLLSRRVEFGVLFARGMEDAHEIAVASGGCIRHAFNLVRSAMSWQDEPPVQPTSVTRAIHGNIADLFRARGGRWREELKHVAATNTFPDHCTSEVRRELLHHLYVLEYQNGDPFPFLVVHPLVERAL